MSGEIISAEEARRLREAATPGPWRITDSDSIAPQVGGAWPVAIVPGDHDDRPWDWDGEGPIEPMPLADAALMAAAPDLARTVEHLHAELAAEREAVLAFLLGMARTAETSQARGLIATIRRALELRYHRDPLRAPREVSDG